MHDYIQALIREIYANASEFKDCYVAAIRLGGGTASHAGPAVPEIVKAIRQSFAVREDVSITMATSTNNISGANFPLFRRAGITRFDLGQMVLFQPAFVKLNPAERFESFALVCDNFIHSYNNDKLGIVLLYGHDELNERDFRRSCVAAANSHASHITFIEAQGSHRGSSETIESHKRHIAEILGNEGFHEYVETHWAREGKEDPYFAGHAKGVNELAFGLGAKTCIDGVVSTNTSDMACYIDNSADYTKITVATERI